MELGQLSSNWKALQKKLQEEKNTKGHTTSSKRKATEATLHDVAVSKKRKLALSAKPAARLSNDKVRRRHMSSELNGSRARSYSTPYKSSKGAKQDATLKTSASTTDLTSTNGAASEHVNEGNSPTAVAGKYVALDCEMVGTGPPPHNASQLARVSLVNYHGDQVYDSFVLPKLAVTDYRTNVSGITPKLLAQGRTFEEVQADVATLLQGRILVGHAVKNDLAVLMLGHPRKDIRDTSIHKPFRQTYCNGATPSLRLLASQVLGLDGFQKGWHSSVEDARVTMMLFKREKDGFEAEAARKFKGNILSSHTDTGVNYITGLQDADSAVVVVKKKTKKKRKKKKH